MLELKQTLITLLSQFVLLSNYANWLSDDFEAKL